MNFPIPIQTRLRPGRAPGFVSIVPRFPWAALVLIALALLLLAAPARADLLVLQSGAASRGIFGEVARVGEHNGALGRGFRPDNEGCQAMWVGADGAVYVAATLVGYGVVTRFTPQGERPGSVADVAGVRFLAGATARDGRTFLIAHVDASAGGNTREIWRIDAGGFGAMTPFVIRDAAMLGAPTALALAANGDLIVADGRAGLVRVDPGTGATRDVLATADAAFGEVSAMTFGPDAALYFGSAQHGAVRRIRAGETQPEEFVAERGNAAAGIAGLAFAADGDLYAMTPATGELRRFDGATGMARGVFTKFEASTRPTAVVFAH